MPFFDQDKLQEEMSTQPAPMVKEEDYSTLDVIGAALKKDNWIGSYLTYGRNDYKVEDASYDPFARLDQLNRPDLYDKVVYSDNDEEVDKEIQRADDLTRQKKILDEAGWGGTIAGLSAGLIDPLIMVPAVGQFKLGTKMFNTLRGAASGASLGAAAAGGSTALRAVSQRDVTGTEIAVNTLAGTIVGSMFGTVLGATAPSAVDGASLIMKNALRGDRGTVEIELPDNFFARSRVTANNILRENATEKQATQFAESQPINPKDELDRPTIDERDFRIDNVEEPFETAQQIIEDADVKSLQSADKVVREARKARKKVKNAARNNKKKQPLPRKNVGEEARAAAFGIAHEITKPKSVIDKAMLESLPDDVLEELGDLLGVALGRDSKIARAVGADEVVEPVETKTTVVNESGEPANLGTAKEGTRTPVDSSGNTVINNTTIKETTVNPNTVVRTKKVARKRTIRVDKPKDINVNVKFANQQKEKDKLGIAYLNDKVTKTIGGGTRATRSVIVNGLVSSSGTVRKLTNKLWNHSFILKGHKGGIATGTRTENAINLGRAKAANTLTFVKQQYFESIGKDNNIRGAVSAGIGGARKKNMTFQEFNEELSHALRNSDKSSNPFIQKAAKQMRKDMDAIVKDLQDLGELPKELDIKTATSWLGRVWDQKKIAVDESGDQVLRGKLINEFAKNLNLPIDSPAVVQGVNKTMDNLQGMGDNELAINTLVDNVRQSGGRFTKERVITLLDNEVEGFLVNDAIGLYSSFMNSANSVVAFKKTLNDLGYENGAAIKKAVNDEYQTALDVIREERETGVSIKGGAARSDEELDELAKQIDKERRDAQDDIDDNVALVLGQFGEKGKHDNKIRLLRKYNILRLLGGVVISSIPDWAMPIFRHGLGRTTKGLYKPFLGSLKGVKRDNRDLAHFGIGVDVEMNTILRSIDNPDYQLGVQQGNVERTADAMLGVFGRASGITYWNNFNRRIAGHISQGRIMDVVKAISTGKEVTTKDREWLASLGIDNTGVAKIWEQFDGRGLGAEVEGSYITNVERWDRDTAELLGSAMLNDVNSTILVPSKSDLPLITQGSETAKLIFQFKSFLFAATNRILLSGLQRRDKDVVAGYASLVVLGGISQNIKDWIRNKDIEEDDKGWDNFVINGINNSGVGGILAAANESLNPMMQDQRWYPQNMASFFAGPTLGSVVQMGKAIGGVTGGDGITQQDAENMRATLPYANLYYLNFLFSRTGDDK